MLCISSRKKKCDSFLDDFNLKLFYLKIHMHFSVVFLHIFRNSLFLLCGWWCTKGTNKAYCHLQRQWVYVFARIYIYSLASHISFPIHFFGVSQLPCLQMNQNPSSLQAAEQTDSCKSYQLENLWALNAVTLRIRQPNWPETGPVLQHLKTHQTT